MAIEIQGRKPTSPAGRKLHLEFWAWRPIHALLRTLCSDLVDDRSLQGMRFGDGSGIDRPEACTQIADRFETWVEQHPEECVLESGIRMTKEGRFVTEQELADNSSLETESAYKTEPEQLRHWIEFLRHCGGFEVW
jgi:hypothetical protein